MIISKKDNVISMYKHGRDKQCPPQKGLFGLHPIKQQAVWDLESVREHLIPTLPSKCKITQPMKLDVTKSDDESKKIAYI